MNKINNKKGSALIVTILLMNLVLFLSLYFLDFSITERKIATSQTEGSKTYYLAEAGIAEMVTKLKNDAGFKTSFETNPSWTTTISRTNPFGAGSGSYTVTLTNSDLAHGEIVSTGIVDVGGGKTSQRIVKTYVYRAIGAGGVTVGENCGYADGNIDISWSSVNFIGGSAHSNNVFNINSFSTVNVDNDLNAVGNLNTNFFSTVNVGGDIHAQNYPPAATNITMPAVDFDSADPNSFKSRATVVYTEAQFSALMQANQNLTLNNPITYVSGDVELKGAQTLVINGLLVVERDMIIGQSLCWGFFRCGNNSITINHTSGQPAGILAKRKINFRLWAGQLNAHGIIYANDQLNVTSFPIGFSFNAEGGLISRKLTITSVFQPINIIRNDEILNDTIGTMIFSPVITVEHWEEEY
ncbi:MAG: hypothetical protein Q7T50_03325 [Candidatus Magasanikbacteria bacterium]|nr:hypothetical protein [Candidatus Magasanikbacteria bacterium]